ncbi:MAG TPA: helix-turn-helix domain-containing protein [Opitutaceae bacterium]|nr:helix-turn-helix domain-containing protein [Opitutaceae bacterium]
MSPAAVRATLAGLKKSRPKRPAALVRSDCPLACTLDLLGDKWTLLVVRDLLLGRRRYGDFVASPEGIPTNILAERLKRLEQAGLLEKTAYQENPVRHEYVPTAACLDLKPVLFAAAEWGNKHIPGTRTDWPRAKA